ncbi:DUF4410 domain-containing protein [Acidocella aromatica]|uniref:Uncharacterized protein YciI n=1 Tax=Acidocella aromatica TaxID=1303579 RepID=A0A840VAP7_9PROT|nr:DUF4410 domain-containing protein [Acidocella aromatica]MBB5372654.1 uncharacterized protein YciI [Acidocella aromatica]
MKRIMLLSVLALVGCAHGHVQTTETLATGALPPPAEVVVTDFVVSPNEVTLDTSPPAERAAAQQGLSEAARRAQAAQDAQQALAEELTAKLQGYGLHTLREPASMAQPHGVLVVRGRILSVDQGNKRRRLLLGLGAGKSSVTASTELYYVNDPGNPELLQTFAGSADSGQMPGAAETMGVGAAAGTLATAGATTAATHGSSVLRGSDEAMNAGHLADALAKQIADYAVAKGWLPASAVQ